MRFQMILFVSGLLLVTLGIIMLPPAFIDWWENDTTWKAFAESSLITLVIGSLLLVANRPHKDNTISVREVFLMTGLSWLLMALCASLPFVLSNILPNFSDALFEATSAITTTGASIIYGLDYTSGGILLWRAILQWLGGIGIIVMAMTVMPILRIGGMQLFQSEFSDRSEKIMPRISQITKAIFWTYVGMTVLCFALLLAAGMPFFDAVCHTFSTVSTGGMSTHDTSIGYFDNSIIEAIIIFFMALAGMTLITLVGATRRRFAMMYKDEQIQAYLLIMGIAIVALTIWQSTTHHIPFLSALRQTAFNVVSLMTSTGFVTSDYSQWGTFAIFVFITVIFIGGCTGSTSSGIKVFRVKIMYSLAKIHLYRLYSPHTVRVALYNGQEIEEPIAVSVFTFLAIFITTFAGMTLALSLTGLDFVTVFSSSMATLTNSGPGLGDIVGPHGNYSALPAAAKWILMAGMLLGRLELITFIVLFLPSFWRR